MIRRIYHALPGPVWARTIVMLLLAVVAVGLLILFYEWVGSTFFDSGGIVG